MNNKLLDIVKRCLYLNPEDRSSAEQLIYHPYFDGYRESFDNMFNEMLEKDKQFIEEEELVLSSQAANSNIHSAGYVSAGFEPVQGESELENEMNQVEADA